MPLSEAKIGQRCQILSLPNHAALSSRLNSMGVRLGCEVQVLRRGKPGGILHLACGVLEFMIRHEQAAEMDVQAVT
jgi:ferrous iron transport protein A